MGLGKKNRRKLDRAEAGVARKARSGRFLRALFVLTGTCAGATAALYAGTWAHRWLTTSPTFAVRSIALIGNRRAPSDELLRLSGLALGANVFEADLDAAAQGISGQPWVKSARVKRVLPNALRVEVTEREPRLLVDLGNLYFADADGSLFKRARPGDQLDLPVVTGFTRAELKDRRDWVVARLRGLVELADAYRERGLDGRAHLEELAFDEDDGITLFVGAGAQAVLLGDEPYDDKLDRLDRLWDELARRGARAQVIHLENQAKPGWVAVKLAAAPTRPRKGVP